MGSKSDLREPTSARQSLSVRLQAFRMRKGWNMDRLSEVAGVSRTTVYHLERGDIAKPRASTLYKLAVALEIDPHELSPDAMPVDASGPGWPPGEAQQRGDPRTKFDLRTNPCIKAAYRGAAAHFTGWSQQEWDELYSTFGVGGPLTEQGVLEIARKINRKRETIHQLQVVLETHHADVAAGLIANLYRLVQAELDIAMPAPMQAPVSQGGGDDSPQGGEASTEAGQGQI
ncbi:helix-turn-helix domain-containing protein [Symmachiella macrocystis]|nr:helix-turn-helix transcriptional regulator [Symmachiella macrocystis]